MAYKLTSEVKLEEKDMMWDVRDMKPGDIGEYWYQDQTHYVLKTYWGLVSLTNPAYCWTSPCDFKINRCQPGTVLTLKIT